MTVYHLAHFNLALLKAPYESSIMSGFVSQLDPIFGVAESSPGSSGGGSKWTEKTLAMMRVTSLMSQSGGMSSLCTTMYTNQPMSGFCETGKNGLAKLNQPRVFYGGYPLTNNQPSQKQK
jgi:hypothetical protein